MVEVTEIEILEVERVMGIFEHTDADSTSSWRVCVDAGGRCVNLLVAGSDHEGHFRVLELLEVVRGNKPLRSLSAETTPFTRVGTPAQRILDYHKAVQMIEEEVSGNHLATA